MLSDLDREILDYLDGYTFDEAYLGSLFLHFKDLDRRRFLRHLVKLVAVDKIGVGSDGEVSGSRYDRLRTEVEADRPENGSELFTYTTK